MMNKLIMRLPIILIGLSLISCDPEETFQDHLYKRVFKNDSNKEIKLVYHNFGSSETDNGNTIVSDTLILPPNSKRYDFFEQGYSSEGVKEDNLILVIEGNVKVYNTTVLGVPKFQLLINSQLKKEWKGIAKYLGESLNTPYNFDSWKVKKYTEVKSPREGEFVYGEIIFTITNEDIE